MLDDQSLPFSPSWFPPSPEPFPQSMELRQDPTMVESENMDEIFAGLFSVPAISEATPTTQQQPPLSNSHGYVQQSDEQGLLNPNTLNSFHEPVVSTMQQHQQPLSNSNGYLQQSDEDDLLQNMLNSFQEPGGSAMQQQQLVCHSNVYVQGNLPNIQSDQQYLSNQNIIMNSFQDPNISTMINIVQQTEEGNNGYAHQQPLIDSFELPNHLQDQFLSPPVPENYPSYPAYQHGPIGSHFNMYEQQPTPRALTNREDEPFPPRMVSDLATTYSQQNQISVIPPQPRMSSSSTRNYFQQNQISMVPPQPGIPSNSTRTCPLQNQNSMWPPPSQVPLSSTWIPQQYQIPMGPPQQNQIPMRPPQSQMRSRSTTTRTHLLQNQISVTSPQLQIPSISTRHHGNAQELVDQPFPSFRPPQQETSTQIRPCTNSLTTPLQTSAIVGRRRRNDQNQFVQGESSSPAQRKRIVLPRSNVDSNAVDHPSEHRIQNSLYDPTYESLVLAIDPILRKFHFQR
ncbi:PREDICTED: transcriptional regulator EFH1-like [Camelina sativa]|uniref:Transcriptional regulator EFH1-like n=1 Tax=Camelina sativa TaxID=90675 RepID=A0ABM0YIX6_CAMSA|nr:PREDICTED: transcriptional regulator EFH1-like [Camelina sativa]